MQVYVGELLLKIIYNTLCSGEWSQQQHKLEFITLLLNNPPAGGYHIPRGPIPEHNTRLLVTKA